MSVYVNTSPVSQSVLSLVKMSRTSLLFSGRSSRKLKKVPPLRHQLERNILTEWLVILCMSSSILIKCCLHSLELHCPALATCGYWKPMSSATEKLNFKLCLLLIFKFQYKILIFVSVTEKLLCIFWIIWACECTFLFVNFMKSKCRSSICHNILAFKLRCALSEKYTLDFKESGAVRNVKYFADDF